MLNENEVKISDKAKEHLNKKYGNKWYLKACKYNIEFNTTQCDECVLLGSNGYCSTEERCEAENRKDSTAVFYKLKEPLDIKGDVLYKPDFSVAKIGDKVQSLFGELGTIVKINSDSITIEYKNLNKNNKNSEVIIDNYGYPKFVINFTKYPMWFYGSFHQFPTKDNLNPTIKKLTKEEIEKELGYNIEIIS